MKQCRKVREQLMDQWSKTKDLEPERVVETNDLHRHLAECLSCRLFRQNLQIIGKNLDDLGIWADDGTLVPEPAYFEKLVNSGTINNPVQFGKMSGSPVRIREVLGFIALGVLILTGAGVAVYHGYLLPVGIVFGLTAMQAPVFILLREPEQERGEFVNEV